MVLLVLAMLGGAVTHIGNRQKRQGQAENFLTLQGVVASLGLVRFIPVH